ncbi:MAG: ATP-binding protein [Alloprevotella sp.]
MKVFKRKIYDKLKNWKTETEGSKALLIEGARRIGKSTIVEEFAKNEYRSYILIDFNLASEAVISAFNNYLNDLDTFFMIIESEYNQKLYRRESVVIFDEIQRFPKARQAVKYLVADRRFDYIETGSLISIRENVNGITLPSEERRLSMYPMDFEEFAWALGDEMMVGYIRKCYERLMPLEQSLHAKAMIMFRQYMIVGGMPQSVTAYIENDRDFKRADMEKRDILEMYRSDIMKIHSAYKSGVIALFDQIPAFLSHKERRVVMKQIDKNASFPTYHDTFFWLADSMMVNQCFNCSDPNVGLSLNEDRTYVKCYMCDTGLLISHTFSENEISDNNLYRELLFGKMSVNEGMFYENAIAQMLVAGGHKLFFYTKYSEEKHRNDIEIDFLISNNSKLKYKVYPIEVKSNDRYTIKSLQRFEERFRQRIGGCYVIHPKNLKVEGNCIFIPAYMTFCL